MARLVTLIFVIIAATSTVVLAAPVVPAAAGVSSVGAATNKFRNFLRGSNLPTASRLKKQFDGLSSTAKTVATSRLEGTSITESEADSVFIHPSGEIFITDAFPSIPETDPTSAEHRRDIISNTVYSSLTTDGIPIFHSKPGSPNTIYLDFNGHVSPSTSAWGAFTASSYDPSNNGPAFTASEQAQINDVWRRVAEDYSPFDVDVTTQEPATYTTRTGHVVITRKTQPNGSPMPSSTSGGISYVKVFGGAQYLTYSPAIVYWDNLAGGRSDAVAEASSHEMGHNLGLSHDGTSTTGYYGGGGSGTQSWAPIMGAAYAQAVTVFNPGNYADANNKEDDVAIISAALGYRADTVGNTAATATAVTVDATGAFTVSGVISTAADVDYFKVVLGSAGIATFSARVFADTVLTRGANLDTRMELYDSTGTNMIAFSDDLTTQDSTITKTLAAGTYYVSIQGVGGALYTDYDSMGQYDFVGSIPPTAAGKVAVPAVLTTTVKATAKAATCSCPASGPKWQSKGTAQLKVPFRTTCSKGFTFNVCLQDVAAQASYTNYRLELYNGNYQVAANLRASSDSSSTANECITYTAPASDAVSGNAYYIVVRSLATGSTMSSWALKSNVASVSTC